MSDGRRCKKSLIIDRFFNNSIFDEFERLFNDLSENSFASGYSISVIQTPEGTKVRAKVGRGVDVNMLRKRLEQQYPGAKIEIEGGKQEPLIEEISTRSVEEEEK